MDSRVLRNVTQRRGRRESRVAKTSVDDREISESQITIKLIFICTYIYIIYNSTINLFHVLTINCIVRWPQYYIIINYRDEFASETL